MDSVTIPKLQRKRRQSRARPPDSYRVELIHDLSEEDKRCARGNTVKHIGEDTLEQLCVIPQQFFVIRHKKLEFAVNGHTRTHLAVLHIGSAQHFVAAL